MFCTNCGEKVDETKRFCPYCGKKLREAPAPPVPRSAPNPTPAPPGSKAKSAYVLMALDAAIAYCALFMPIAAASFLPYSASLLDIAQGSGKLASLSGLAGSSSVTETLNNVSGFAWIVVLAVVASVAVDLYHDFKGDGRACSGFIALSITIVGAFTAGANGVVEWGSGVWALGFFGIVSILMHLRRFM